MPILSIDTAQFILRRDVPAARQVAAYLKAMIALGRVSSGEPMPPPAALASKLGSKPSDVKRAYAELVERGFLVSGAGRWTVSDEPLAASRSGEAEEISDRLFEVIDDARRAGFTRAELRRLFDRLLAKP